MHRYPINDKLIINMSEMWELRLWMLSVKSILKQNTVMQDQDECNVVIVVTCVKGFLVTCQVNILFSSYQVWHALPLHV